MTIKQAAPYVGASEYKLRELVRNKKIPAYRVGAKILFRKEALDQWIADQESKNCSSVD
ncbi:helix-turn-helix domain-containing protein [Paenibacillus donghaensis]|nr:helix-turn-helix domain-containing protein [Paenibacillus donghaensis]